MNESTHPDRFSDVPWPTHDQGVRVPDTSMLPGSEKLRPASDDMLNDAVQGAHQTVDRLADRAEPLVHQVQDGVSAAAQVLHAKTAEVRKTRDAWVDGARTRVRGSPLACVAGAVALGVVIARLTR